MESVQASEEITLQDSGRNIVVGVAGGIAAYKTCQLIRDFKEAGDNVTVVPTEAALQFVGAATFEALSGNPVSSSVFDAVDSVRHVRVGKDADLIVVAPATADFLARVTHGRADDLLTATLLVATCPIVLAPAMHTEMWFNAATQDNVKKLRDRGIIVLEPAHGRLTGKDTGLGRLPEPIQIAQLSRAVLAGAKLAQSLTNKKVLISAGGTREAIDPVRFIGNHSSGKQGFALAEIATQRGAQVTIVAGITDELPIPSGAKIIRVSSALEMRQAMLEQAGEADVIIMSAAVADYRPSNVAEAKLKKGIADNSLGQLRLVENPDILAELVAQRASGQWQKNPVIIGFAAETGDERHTALEYGQAKLQRKGCDLLMCNDVSAGQVFGQGTNAGYILDAHGGINKVKKSTKLVVAAQIIDASEKYLAKLDSLV
ncbi:bifunctional phosphopantothenoylcysteine decarboxylase/phosphopantothenate--cysteine ligase CoaBC [Corynebacterium kutscheri]|uniref:bifunctional phosphopantothenoylcysteine decarboxylase/phosphopantothenate--cysteine ligase CoaBC n=1 Tax=Corynebacterium kutscheri TaxID=35755 RepID=UPI000F823975|nr:bifunctional phosphopantothenoylcysteine decarboxylase/phosphopantothenate--cysteine ligase CoaBC [Corynebacterium kutscheri]